MRENRDNVAYEKAFVGENARPNKWRADAESCSETLRLQCGEDGVGKRKIGPIAYRAISGRLT